MEPNDSRSLNWKICFKKILAPHLLNSAINEEQNNEIDVHHALLNTESDSLSTYSLPSYPGRRENVQKDITLPITKEFVQTDENNQPFFNGLCHNQEFDFPDDKLNSFESPVETEENIANIIAADAEELAKSFKVFKVSKKNKNFYKAESSRRAPNWNNAFKKILNPKAATESSMKTPTLEPYRLKMVDCSLINPWTFHRLSREDLQQSGQIEELPAQSSSEKSNNKKHYTTAEENVVELLRSSRSFKQRKKPHINTFDGAGVNCFKNDKIKFSTENTSSNTEKPKNIPPTAGWVGVGHFTLEEARTFSPT